MMLSIFRTLSNINNITTDKAYIKNSCGISPSKIKKDLKIAITARYRKAFSLSIDAEVLIKKSEKSKIINPFANVGRTETSNKTKNKPKTIATKSIILNNCYLCNLVEINGDT